MLPVIVLTVPSTPRESGPYGSIYSAEEKEEGIEAATCAADGNGDGDGSAGTPLVAGPGNFITSTPRLVACPFPMYRGVSYFLFLVSCVRFPHGCKLPPASSSNTLTQLAVI